MKNIGIFGGTFNPIHNGHLYIAEEALNTLKLDEVVFVPSGRPPHKKNDKNLLDEDLRYEMAKMAIRGYENFSLTDYEIRKKGLSYTYETLKYFNSIYKDSNLYFITGADCLIDIYKWKNIEEIFKEATLVVFNRYGVSKEEILKQKAKVEEAFGKEVIFLDTLSLDISSTFIRKAIKAEYNLTYFLPPSVRNFIKELKLYK